MLRTIFPFSLFVIAGCASTRTNDLVLAEPGSPPSSSTVLASVAAPVATPAESSESSGLWTARPAESIWEPAIGAAAVPSTSAAEEEALRTDRFTIKAGLYEAEDADELDDGYIINLAWMHFFSKLLAIEFEAGYYDADGEEAGIEADVWGAPLMVNGRLNLPVWILDLYAGLGVGTVYFNADVSGGNDDDGFLLAGNAFIGGTVNIADKIALGLEGKYYVTEESDDLDASLDAFALMLTLGFSR